MPNDCLQILHCRQSNPGACLPACVRMVLTYWGHETSEAKLARLMGAYWYGTPLSRVSRLSSLGFQVVYEQASLEQLRAYLAQRLPIIVFVRTGSLAYWNENVAHAVVVVGLDNEQIYLHDPSLDSGPNTVDIPSFMLAWSDLDYYCATLRPV